MENLNFIDLTYTTAVILFLVGFVGGMVSGFIGSGGAFVLTPAMMSLGVPGVVAVASNMAHKFPKALVGAHKRNKYGQVDIKLGVVLGIFAEAGVLFGKIVCKLTGGKVNPLIGAAGISAFPMAARVVQAQGQLYDKKNHLLMHAAGVNTGGQIGSVVAAAVMLSVLKGMGLI